MFICEKFNFIYFGNPKTGSSKIISLIKKNFKIKELANTKSSYFPNTAHHSIYLPKKYENYFKFTSIRNPYCRELSKFNSKPKYKNYQFLKNMSFEYYIEWICDKKLIGNWVFDYWKLSQKKFIFYQEIPNKDCVPVQVDYYVRFENFIEDFLNIDIFKKISINELTTFVNKTNYETKHFPLSKKDLFYESFKEDFEYFKYSKKIPKKLSCAKFL